jgi:hypothetical protein
MKINDIAYPVILTYEDDIIYVSLYDFSFFPDGTRDYHPTYGSDLTDALQHAKELLTLEIYDREKYGQEIPVPSDLTEIQRGLKKNQKSVYVAINYPFERAGIQDAYVKKILKIPASLHTIASEKKLDYSKLLQRALERELGIKAKR